MLQVNKVLHKIPCLIKRKDTKIVLVHSEDISRIYKSYIVGKMRKQGFCMEEILYKEDYIGEFGIKRSIVNYLNLYKNSEVYFLTIRGKYSVPRLVEYKNSCLRNVL